LLSGIGTRLGRDEQQPQQQQQQQLEQQQHQQWLFIKTIITVLNCQSLN